MSEIVLEWGERNDIEDQNGGGGRKENKSGMK